MHPVSRACLTYSNFFTNPTCRLTTTFSCSSRTVGYVYFDVFNQHYLQQPTLRSVRFPAMTGDEPVKTRCLSFWFSAFGRGDNSVLGVHLLKLEESEAGGGGDPGASGGGSGAAAGDSAAGDSAAGGEGKPAADGRILLWSIQSRFLETRRNLWYYAQTAVNAETEHQVRLPSGGACPCGGEAGCSKHHSSVKFTLL